jgi:histidyl-tRNA synthetase
MPPRGTRDILPAEARVRERVIDAARERFAAYGYSRIVTPTFEETEVFLRGVGMTTDVVRKEMYTFTDGGGRSLSLRPEGTAPVARAFVEHGMHKLPAPVKLWYLAPMFRYEAPQAGRFREHYQLGAEALGSDDPLLDAEAIALLADLYGRLEVPGVHLAVSSMGDEETRQRHRAALLDYLSHHAHGLSHEYRQRLEDNPLRLFDAKDEHVRHIMAGAPKLLDMLSPPAEHHWRRVLSALDTLEIRYDVDKTLVRGFDYYTHTVFEFTSDRLGAQSAIGGGGRYDHLVEWLGGPPTPGVGFGTGVERIVLAIESADAPAPAPALDCYLAATPELRLAMLPLLAELRVRGLRCESAFGERGLRSMLRHADTLGARRVVIVGPRDHEAGVATVRDMRTGDQEQVPLERLVAVLAGEGP